jgi:hypothetical protein
MKTKKFLAITAFASMPGQRWERGKPGSRRVQATQHDLEALDLMAKSLYVTSTFMRLLPGGLMHPGRDHEAEKSTFYSISTAKALTWINAIWMLFAYSLWNAVISGKLLWRPPASTKTEPYQHVREQEHTPLPLPSVKELSDSLQ